MSELSRSTPNPFILFHEELVDAARMIKHRMKKLTVTEYNFDSLNRMLDLLRGCLISLENEEENIISRKHLPRD